MMTPSVWTGIYVSQPLAQALRTLHAGGWRAFEVSTEHLEAIEAAPDGEAQIAAACACASELRLVMPQAHAHLGADVASFDADQREADIVRIERHLAISAQLGAKAVVVHPGGKGYTTRDERKRIMALNVDAFRRLGDVAGSLGQKIGMENLMRRWRTPAELYDLLDAINHPAIGFTIDTSHANVEKLHIPDVIRDLGPHLVATHISDNDGSGDQHRVPGSGTVDWLGVMEAFKELRYAGIFNLEIPGERNKIPALHDLKLRHALAVTEWLVSLA